MSGDDLPEFVGRVLRAANTSPPAKVTISSSAVTEPTTAEERARIVALLRKWADDAVAANLGWKGWLRYGYIGQRVAYGRALALRRAADRIEGGDDS